MGDWWLEGECWKPKNEDIGLFCRSPQIHWRKRDTQMFVGNLDGMCSNASVQCMPCEEGKGGGRGRVSSCPAEREWIRWLSAKISRRLHRTKRSLCCPGTTSPPWKQCWGSAFWWRDMDCVWFHSRLEPGRAEKPWRSTVPAGLYLSLSRSPGRSYDPGWLQNPGITTYISHFIRV